MSNIRGFSPDNVRVMCDGCDSFRKPKDLTKMVGLDGDPLYCDACVAVWEGEEE